MRSASCGVVIEPSTSERSYGPSTGRARGLEEVGDLELAGQREQLVLAVEEAELAAVAGGELPHGELRLAHSSRIASQRLDVRRSGRPGRRGRQRRAELAVPAEADRRTACCAPARRRCGRRATPRSASAGDGEAHHHLRPAEQRDARCRVERRAVDQPRDDADAARATPAGASTVTATSSPRAARRSSSSGVEQLVGRARRRRAARGGRSARGARAARRIAGPQRRQPDAAGDDDDVGALAAVDRPRRAERPAHAEHVARARRRRSRASRRRPRARCARARAAVAGRR